jgi:anti-anti-sigma regulatory factor
MVETVDRTGEREALPAVADFQAAGLLKTRLEQALAAGGGLTLDASAVQRIGSSYLQVLVAGVAAFAKAGGPSLQLEEPSAVFREAVTVLGLTDALGLKWARQS